MPERLLAGTAADGSGITSPSSSAPAAVRPAPGGSDTESLAPDVRGGRFWQELERWFLYADRVAARALPAQYNPLLHSGAIAMLALVVALVSGVLLLFWYRPSLHMAWSSTAAMGQQPWGAGLVRSLHRYSSDVAIVATIVHAVRLISERRFTGPRWLAWVTGVLVVGLVWFVGWTGYWLVWDTRAHAIAAGTARALDVLPIFADPMGRSLLTDRGLNSLLFFVVFFAHMLVPLGMAVLLWLHVARLARPQWIAKGTLALWTTGAMVALSAVWPADVASRARMTAVRGTYTIDAWYLAPLVLTDRLPGAALWAIALAPGLVLFTAPWWMARRRPKPATIYPARCVACGTCVADCPYDAITMVPRVAGQQKYALQAHVDTTKCVGCGICSASCEGFGTDLLGFSSVPEMRRAEGWVREAVAIGEAPTMVFACAHSAGAALSPDPVSGRCSELRQARVLKVPCAGWVHTTIVERMLRVGASRVTVVACAPGSCHYREGADDLVERIEGRRDPHFRGDLAPRDRVEVLRVDRTRAHELLNVLSPRGRPGRPDATPSRVLTTAGAMAISGLICWGVGLGSVWSYASPAAGSELVITFKHPGQVSEQGREISQEELERTPIHMRRARVFRRERAPVRMRVVVDGRTVVDRAYQAKGIWRDGNSVAVEAIQIAPGQHVVDVAIGDTHDGSDWTHRTSQRLEFTTEARRVVAFDRLSGFTVE